MKEAPFFVLFHQCIVYLIVLVHMYHEVSQLFRKEPRDFCILQSERIEGVKYLISLQSVDWHKCPEAEDVPRAKVTL